MACRARATSRLSFCRCLRKVVSVMTFARVSMKYVTRRAVPSQVNRNSNRPPPSGRACGTPERRPELGEPVERAIGHRLVLALERGVPVLDLRGDLRGPVLAHLQGIAPTLYRVHAIARILSATVVT